MFWILSIQSTPPFKGGTFISNAVTCWFLLISFTQQSLNWRFCPMAMDITLWQVLKCLYIRLLENETLKIFSMREINRGKHKFSGTKVFETVEGKKIKFKSLNSKWIFWLACKSSSLNFELRKCSMLFQWKSIVKSN